MSDQGVAVSGGTVVVGVDGSDGATEALRWALAEARLRKVPLRIIHAWMYGYLGSAIGGYGYLGYFGSPVFTPDLDVDLQRAAEEMVEKTIAGVLGDADDVEIERAALEGPSAAILIGAVGAGDLLVVGSRGHGGFTGGR
jgi:nucleotide-binding universal stress UspA family protein